MVRLKLLRGRKGKPVRIEIKCCNWVREELNSQGETNEEELKAVGQVPIDGGGCMPTAWN